MTEQKRPEISIIVAVYKGEKYLNGCVDAILNQTFRDFEVILVDDGSPDNCPAMCDAIAKRDSRVRVIHQENKGVDGAKNAGIDSARGNWIGFVDQDDLIDRPTMKNCTMRPSRPARRSPSATFCTWKRMAR